MSLTGGSDSKWPLSRMGAGITGAYQGTASDAAPISVYGWTATVPAPPMWRTHRRPTCSMVQLHTKVRAEEVKGRDQLQGTKEVQS